MRIRFYGMNVDWSVEAATPPQEGSQVIYEGKPYTTGRVSWLPDMSLAQVWLTAKGDPVSKDRDDDRKTGSCDVKACCGNCCFWVQRPDIDGHCHRFPPVGYPPRWPEVMAGGSCGEHGYRGGRSNSGQQVSAKSTELDKFMSAIAKLCAKATAAQLQAVWSCVWDSAGVVGLPVDEIPDRVTA